MADYHTETVVTPDIPASDMTPLERLVLSLVFDEEEWPEGVYFSTWTGPNNTASPVPEDLRAAWEASQATESRINPYTATLLAQYDATAEERRKLTVDIDLTTPEVGWPDIVQDIVRRSPSVDEVVVWAAYTCTKMYADGFGGGVTRITPLAIQHSSTADMLESLRASAPSPEYDGETFRRLNAIAETAGWDSSTLLAQIAQWVDENGEPG